MNRALATGIRRWLALLAPMLLLALAPGRAQASFHLWDIVEVFSNADGSIQYIELSTASAGQEFLQGHVITATSTTGGNDTVHVFNFAYDLSGGSTAGERFLIATPGFANLPGAPTPDYTLPCGAFFDPDADTITIDFAGWDVVSFTSAQLPTDGVHAIDQNDASITASPEAFLGAPGSLGLTACQISGACDACDDGAYCNGAESCSGSACSGGTDPCPGEMCDEAMDACVECLDAGDCSDGNVCTNDVCNAGTCQNPNNTASCNDGKFCTATDTCSGGTCSGAGNPCTGADMCSETMDACVECLVPADCSNGSYCDGAETCTLGSCGAGNPPCVGDEMCDEAGDACVECLGAGDCDDDNPCTDDDCAAGSCTHDANTAGCDDGKFCTATDVCAGGACTGSGDPCAGQNCLEGSDSCGDCTGAGDCDDGNACTVNTCDSNACVTTDVTDGTGCSDDGLFCNGTESCQAGACTGAGNPCDSGETCDDALDACRAGCGDAIVAGAEDCDDGNLEADDGCSPSCELEDGYACTKQGNASVCAVVYGDGLVVGDEACDDGNQQPDDGCFEGAVDPGYHCDDAMPSVCTEDAPDAGADASVADAGPAADGGATGADASTAPAGDAGGDAAAPSGGSGDDASGLADAGMIDDVDGAAAGGAGSGGDDGCSCRTTRPLTAGSTLPWLGWAAVLLLRARRRRG